MIEQTRRRRLAMTALRWAGYAVGVAGAACVAAGAVLPWVSLVVFGAEIAVPGVTGWGALTLALGVVVVLHGIRWPLLAVPIGLLILAVGLQQQRDAGRVVKGRILALQQSLAGVNDRLMRVGIPPIEPFPLGRRWEEYVGPGPLWTAAGGAALAVAGATVFTAGRLGRSCPRCGTLWLPERVGQIAFCPACGVRVGPPAACSVCSGDLEPGDNYCPTCGATVGS